MNPYPRTWIDVDLGRLSANLARVRAGLPAATGIALVAKADAYGHGLVPVARHAVRAGGPGRADWVAVATVQEGIALRDAGLDGPVLVLSPILPVEAEQAVFYRLRTMLESVEIGEALAAAAQAQRARAIVHLAVDTGLSRFGAAPGEAVAAAEALAALPGLALEGIGTHFVDSAHDADRTEAQWVDFRLAVDAVRAAGHPVPVVHAANSAAAVRHASAGADLVRVGIAAYGIDPYGLGGLAPAMAWRARVMTVRERPAGSTVGYASTWRAPRPVRIATLGVGYGDGYPRSLSNRGEVALGGRRCPVVGLVCMDQTMVDVTDVPDVAVGDEAVLLGDDPTAVELAGWGATNVHEVVTRIMSRVPRRHLAP